MKKKTGMLLAVLLAVTIMIGGKKVLIDDSQITDSTKLTASQKERKEKVKEIYTEEYQDSVQEKLDALKAEGSYTEDNMLIRKNPYGTNTLSLYVWFETEKPAKISYTVHAEKEGIDDFSMEPYRNAEYVKEHEYQIIGLIPDTENEITFSLEYEDGTSEEKTIRQEMGSLWGEEKVCLAYENEVKDAGEKLTDGLYVILGNDSSKLDFMYYYDNNGVLRGEVPLLGYRSHRLITQDGRMYYSISEKKIAAVNRLGRAEAIYDLGKYELHHDYVFDDDGNLLILASDTEEDRVEDMLVKTDIRTGETECVLDLAELFGDYKETCRKNADGELDWMHINTLQWIGEGSVILSSRETSAIIKIDDLYGEPEVSYMIGEESFWEGTGYEDLFLKKDGEFSNTGGQHSVTYETDDALPDGQYYLYMFNNNLGVSESQPGYDWGENIQGIAESAKEDGACSWYYKYLVDEKKGTYSLAESFELPFSGYVSSVQEKDGNVIADSGMAGTFGEYDGNGNVLRAFKIDTEKFVYRVYKYDFKDFYFAGNAA